MKFVSYNSSYRRGNTSNHSASGVITTGINESMSLMTEEYGSGNADINLMSEMLGHHNRSKKPL